MTTMMQGDDGKRVFRLKSLNLSKNDLKTETPHLCDHALQSLKFSKGGDDRF